MDADTLKARFDTLKEMQDEIRAADWKANFLVAFYIAILGATMLQAKPVWDGIANGTRPFWCYFALAVFILVLLVFVVSLFNFVPAVKPNRGARLSPAGYSSMLHWEYIARLSIEQLGTRLESETMREVEKDLVGQLHAVATIADKKARHIERCYSLLVPFMLGFVLLVIAVQLNA